MQELHPVILNVLALLEQGGAEVPDPTAALELLRLELEDRPNKAERRPVVESAIVLAYWLYKEKGAPDLGREIVRLVASDLPTTPAIANGPSEDRFDRAAPHRSPARVRELPRQVHAPEIPMSPASSELQRRMIADRMRRTS